MEKRFLLSIKKMIKAKKERFHKLCRKICGRRIVNNKYYLFGGNLER